jgi:tRNA (guanine37-N1)-methyltransferase
VTVLEQEISDVDERGRAAFVGEQRRAERLERVVATIERNERDPAFVVSGYRSVGAIRIRERRVEGLERVLKAAVVKGGYASFVGRRGLGAPARGEESADVEHRSHNVLHIDVITLFPEFFAPSIGLSILGRAQERGLVRIELHHLLDALGDGERADDRPFGGGPGMVLRIEPLARVLDAILDAAPSDERRAIVVTAAAGAPFRQRDAERFATLDRLVIVCGHYEGIDERLVDLYGAEEVSLGDFVLTGGEIPALAFVDATVRLVAGAINAESLASESFTGDTLDSPAYTRPAAFRGKDVPGVLLSGDHAKIAAWRREQSRERTIARRNDLLERDHPSGGEAPNPPTPER